MTDEEWKKKLNTYFIGFNRKVFRWSPAYREVLRRTFVRKDKNGDWYKCEQCGEVILRKNKHVDHIVAIVDRGGWDGDWNLYRDRCHVSADKLRLLCKRPCHYEKTQKENAERRKIKADKTQKKAA